MHLKQAAEDSSVKRGKNFWASQREEAARCIDSKQLPPRVSAMLVAAFARAGELTAPFAENVARQICAALVRRREAAAVLLREPKSPHEGSPADPPSMSKSADFFAVATLLVAMRDGGVLGDPEARAAARAIQNELVQCMQASWDSLTFSQLRRAMLLFGGTAETLGIEVDAAHELLTAVKKLLREMQKKGHLSVGGDPRDSIALLWPLASISIVMNLRPPGAGGSHRLKSNQEQPMTSCGGNKKWDDLCQTRDILLHLLKSDVSKALSSRLPCSPLDLALVSCYEYPDSGRGCYRR